MTSIRSHCIGDPPAEPSPEQILDQLLVSVPAAELHNSLLMVDYPYVQYWLDDQPAIRLLALFSFTLDEQELTFAYTVTPASGELARQCQSAESLPYKAFEALCQQYRQPVFSPGQAANLIPIAIPKPWGQEIWYTGIEPRGVAAVGYQDCQIELPYWLSVLPERLLGSKPGPPLLLKILDPLPEAVQGDLYWELHRDKREVYVITAIDRQAWPTGQGAIRFGLNQQKRAEYTSDTEFREAYLQAIHAYEQVRRAIDTLLDSQADSLAAVPARLREQELHLREVMQSFTHTQAVAVGDVIKVPCLTPHALQHGVRTVEFQTPVYERMIISFAQKVLTQSHWDSAQAVALMNLDFPPQEQPQEQPQASSLPANRSAHCIVERIVDFEDFEVHRVHLGTGGQFSLPAPADYAVLIVIQGDMVISDMALVPEAAVILPNSLSEQLLINSGTDPMVFLLAYPK